MVTESWERVKSNVSGELRRMEKLFPNYSYFDEQRAIFTDKRVCSTVKQELNSAKVLLFDVIGLSSKLRLSITDHLERHKDDLDILLDEIDMKAYKWDERIPEEWLQKIVEYDIALIEKAENLQKDITMLWDELKKTKEGVTSSGMKIKADVIKQKINTIARMFQERSEIFDIRQSVFNQTFDRIKQNIARRI
jgi:hypothetical protein